MQDMNFSIDIKAPKEKVWEVLWDDSSYRKWAGVFNEGSHAVSDWEEGSKVLFLGEDGGGMVSKIEKKKPNEFMSFKHLGTVHKGVEDLESAEAKQWSGAMENYTLKENGDVTELKVDLTGEGTISDDFRDYFMQTFPKALEQVKVLAEDN